MLQPLGKGLLQALGADEDMWIAQSSFPHFPIPGVCWLTVLDPQQLQDTALNVSHMADDPWEGGLRSGYQGLLGW